MAIDRVFDFSGIMNAIPDIDNPQFKGSNPVLDACKKIDEKNSKINAELEKYRQESLVDSLTGCYNRNYFEKFKKENFDPNRDHNTLSLVFIDLNNLKQTNDLYGHEAGDKLIKDSADYFRSIFRKEDTLIRLGGDEFVVICRNYKEDPNFESGLNTRLKQKRDEKILDSTSPISFAFGVAAYDQVRDLKNIENTQSLADQRMYQDKKAIKSNNKN